MSSLDRSGLGRRAMLRSALVLAVAAPAVWSRPVQAAGMGADMARHLLARTGFGPTPAEISAIEALEYGVALDRLLRAPRTEAVSAPPGWINVMLGEVRAAQRANKERLAAARNADPRNGGAPPNASDRPLPSPPQAVDKPKDIPGFAEQGRQLLAWWFEEMLATDQPLVERMVLFWHNHFTSALQNVRYVPAMYRQNALFRRHAMGNFATLLREVARDPAMLTYLDNARSEARRPNENFARELLELFTLGEGHYTEADVKAAARAFTGWGIDRESGAFRFHPDKHDRQSKTFLGRTGDLDGGDIIDIILAQPRTAELIVGKLWREFVSLKVDNGELKRLAAILRDAKYELRPLLKAMFSSPTFLNAISRGRLIKSPVELVVGTARVLGDSVLGSIRLFRVLASMGQVPLYPPSVKGWDGGEAWITTNTLLARRQLVQRFIEATWVGPGGGDPGGMSPPGMTRRGRRADRLEQLDMGQGDRAEISVRLGPALAGLDVPTLTRALLPLPPQAPLPATVHSGEAVARLLLDPVYQLK